MDRNHVERSRRLARGSARWLAVWASAGVLVGTPAVAATPRQALDVVAPEVIEAEERLAAVRTNQTLLRQFDAGVTVEPSFLFFDDLTDPGAADFDADVDVEATVGYSYDPAGVLSDQVALVRAEAAVATARRRGIEAALAAHVRLLRAQVGQSEAEADLAAAEREVATAREQLAAGSATPRDVESAELDLERQQLRSSQAEETLRNAMADAAALGLDTVAEFERLRFVLPDVAAADTSTYRLLQLEVARQQAALTDLTVFGTISDLTVSGTYATGDVRFGSSVGIIDTVPRGEIEVGYPGGRDRWAVELAASISVDTGLLAVPEREADIQDAVDALAAYPEAFEQRADRTRTAATFAEQGFALEQRQMVLTQGATVEAEQELARLQEAVANASDADRAELESQLEDALDEAQRAQSDLLRGQQSLYRSWATYVARVGDYLDVVEGEWVVAEP